MKFKKENFKKLLKEQRWKIKALSAKLNTGRTTIHLWLNGHHEPPKEKIIELSKVLNVPTSELIEIDLCQNLNSKNESLQSPIKNLFSLADAFDNNTVKNTLSFIFNTSKELKTIIDKLAIIVDSIMETNPIPIYIKNEKQHFVAANKAFRKTLALPDDYTIQGKQDANIFPADEAKFNTAEDYEVFITGKPVENQERLFPGTRKKKWCIASKIPLYISTTKRGSPTGVMGILIDVSDKRKSSIILNVLEDCLKENDNLRIWIANEINKEEPFLPTNLIYLLLGKSLKQVHLDHSLQEILQLYNNELIVEEFRKKLDFRKINEDNPVTIKYKSKRIFKRDSHNEVVEFIGYNPKFNVHYGIMSAPDSKKLAKSGLLTEQKRQKLVAVMKNNNIPEKIIDMLINEIENTISE